VKDKPYILTRRRNSDIIKFYKDQIKKFYKIGIGNKTEFKTIVTEQLIENTKKRLAELQAADLINVGGLSNNGLAK
jgi:uncharacterized protein YaaR (DUF327 family)